MTKVSHMFQDSSRSSVLLIAISLGFGLLGGIVGAGGLLYVVAHPVALDHVPWASKFAQNSFVREIAKVPAILVPSSTQVVPPAPATHPDSAITTEDAIVKAIQKAKPAVVSISITKTVTRRQYNIPLQDFFNNDPFFSNVIPEPDPATGAPEKRTIGGGSGFLVSKDGMIVTNKHVVSDTEAEFTVTMQDGKTFPATVVALDPAFDIAIIKIAIENAPYLELGDSDALSVGQTVIAIGNALAEFQNSVTKGVISGLNRTLVAGGASYGAETIEGAIQTDAAINHGNSGGPLLNIRGQVIGVNTAVSEQGQSLGFALPINAVKRDIASVKKTGKIIRAWLGVRYIAINDEVAKKNALTYKRGALVIRGEQPTDLAVSPGSPADKAGIVENDIILSVNGDKVDDAHSLASLLSRASVGDRVQLLVVHQGIEKTITVTLTERPST